VVDGVPIAKAATATLKIPGFADFLALDGDGAWVTNKGRVERLTATDITPVATVPLSEPCGAMATDFGSLWVADCKERAVVRIGLASHKVEAKIPTGLADPTGELSIATGAGSVWILSDPSGKLARIDPATDKVIATIPVAAGSFAAAFGFGSVWITTTSPGSVQRIDPATNAVVATIPVGPVPRFLAAGEGGVWTLNQGDGSVSRIDPATNTVSATIEAGVSGGGGDIASGGGKVWVRGRKTLLLVIDPRDNRILRRYGPQAGSGAVRADSTHVWVTAHDTQEVWVLPARQD
jgi:YVTN family beta-propeller protein